MTKKVLLINVFIFLIILLSVEGISRLLVVKKNVHPIFNDEELRIRGRNFVQKNETKGFSLVPGFKNNYYGINNKGFRGEAFPTNLKTKFIILSLGESTTFGWGVRQNETYPYCLQQKLNKIDSKFYVINGGVPSYTSSQVLLYMKEILSKKDFTPDLILINIMWNDIWYSSIKNWHPNILVHQKQPTWLSLLIEHSYFFYGLLKTLQRQEKSSNIFNEKAYKYYQDNISAMIRLASKKGVKIAFVEAPFDSDHMSNDGLKEFKVHYTKEFLIKMGYRYNNAMQNLAKNYNIPVIKHGLGLQNIHQKSLFIDALHPTAEGNFMLAEDIFKGLLKANFLK